MNKLNDEIQSYRRMIDAALNGSLTLEKENY